MNVVLPSELIVLYYVVVPPEGTPVPSNIAKRAGPYLLGPTLGSSPVKSIVQCLARLEGSDEFYTLKVIATANYVIQYLYKKYAL